MLTIRDEITLAAYRSSLDHVHFAQTLIRLVHSKLSFYFKIARQNIEKCYYQIFFSLNIVCNNQGRF